MIFTGNCQQPVRQQEPTALYHAGRGSFRCELINQERWIWLATDLRGLSWNYTTASLKPYSRRQVRLLTEKLFFFFFRAEWDGGRGDFVGDLQES